jgi:hypothetical protein
MHLIRPVQLADDTFEGVYHTTEMACFICIARWYLTCKIGEQLQYFAIYTSTMKHLQLSS